MMKHVGFFVSTISICMFLDPYFIIPPPVGVGVGFTVVLEIGMKGFGALGGRGFLDVVSFGVYYSEIKRSPGMCLLVFCLVWSLAFVLWFCVVPCVANIRFNSIEMFMPS